MTLQADTPTLDHLWTLEHISGNWCAVAPKADPTAKLEYGTHVALLDGRHMYPFGCWGPARTIARGAVDQANGVGE